MQTRSHQGAIESDLTDLLLSLHVSSRTGRLSLERDGVRRELYVSAGLLVSAESSARDDSLEWMLFTTGALTEERHAAVRSMIEEGARPGRALVDSGSVSPSGLCEWTERRARYLAGDALAWKGGRYEFEEGLKPPAGAIPLGLSLVAILLAALREGSAAGATRLPPPELVLEPATGTMPGLLVKDHLLPHEAYVLSLVDGRRKVSEICFLSEIGETETLRSLGLLSRSGCLRACGVATAARMSVDESSAAADLAPPIDLPSGDSTAEMRAIVRIYNDLYAFLYAHMIKEVGPIAEQLLEKHLREARDLHAALFNRSIGGRDGCLPEDQLIRNMNLIKDQNRRDLLVAGMHDYLRAMVIAVRRILGPAHEGLVVRRLRELRCSRT